MNDPLNSYEEVRTGVGTQGSMINPIFGIAHGVGVAGENLTASFYSNDEQGAKVGKGAFDPAGGIIKDIQDDDIGGVFANILGLGAVYHTFRKEKNKSQGNTQILMGLSDPLAGFKSGELGKDYGTAPINNKQNTSKRLDRLSAAMGGLTSAGSSFMQGMGGKNGSNPLQSDGSNLNFQSGSIFDTRKQSRPKFGGNATDLNDNEPLYNPYSLYSL